MPAPRHEVLAALDVVLADARAGRGAAIVICGPPGIGKSALLEDVRGRCDDALVISVAGSEAERTMPLAGVTQLCAPLVESLHAIPDHQAALIRVALGLIPEPKTAQDNEIMALGLALLSLLAEAGRGRGIVLLVDDAQWLDASSVQIIDFLGRRLGGTAVALIACQRSGDGGVRLPNSIELDVLGIDESIELLTRAGVDRHVAVAIAARTSGLPLLLRRIAESLSPNQRSGLAPLPDPLPAGADLEAGYVAVLDHLDATERRAVLLLAALGEQHDVRAVDSAAMSLLEGAESLGLVCLDARGQRFTHPIARSAAYWSASPGDRRAVHRAIADSMPVDDPAEVWHRSAASAGPDDLLAMRLISSGEHSTRRGGAASAVIAFQRAAELAVDNGLRVRAMVRGAAAALAAGTHPVAEMLLTEAEASGAPPESLIELRAALAAASGSPERARRLLSELAASRRADDPEAAAAAFVGGALLSLRMLDVAAAEAALSHASICLSERVGSSRLQRRVDTLGAVIALHRLGSDDNVRTRVVQMLRELHQIESEPDDIRFLADAVTLALGWAGGDASLLALADELHRRHAETLPSIVPALLVARATHLSRSDLAGAAAAAEQAVELAEELRQGGVHAVALSWLASAQAGLCVPQAVDTCRAVEAAGGEMAMVSSRVSLGFYLLGLEHYDDAFATLMTLHEWAAGTVRAGMYWQADLAEAAIRVGRFDVAEEQREILADLVSASTSPWVVAVHDRVCAQLCDDLDEAATGFESAIVRLTEGGFSVAAARASLMLGERLRRARRRAAARGRLVDARRAFDHAGMSHWAARCDRELAAAGAVAPAEARTVAHAVLSPQELQVARWVVAGESNREIAGRLFLSPRTVEAHLSAIYRKLGVRGRGGLTGLGRTDPSLVAAPPSTHSVHTDTS